MIMMRKILNRRSHCWKRRQRRLRVWRRVYPKIPTWGLLTSCLVILKQRSQENPLGSFWPHKQATRVSSISASTMQNMNKHIISTHNPRVRFVHSYIYIYESQSRKVITVADRMDHACAYIWAAVYTTEVRPFILNVAIDQIEIIRLLNVKCKIDI